ncbi:FAD-binding oxidoreductase [Anianabacter salinae]|uniref:FAD-binding oxidoreductase n=1 Tax=Anianabacter salinae TaxID=2851023 RepID=UPI00225E2BE6|nr:FAD-binding oxidoreductase [Anianabacter salinae]MBV0911805.1 FAD-binding oxidoreductase [Anianabacter salinae]
MIETLSGWGRTPRIACDVLRPRTEAQIAAALGRGSLIARGNGRAYGDAALNAGLTVDMRGMDHMLGFDPETGVLEAEAGVLLSEIIAAFLPRGWFLPVTPGTKFVTLGGAIAADVHGKNHHIDGSFGAFVDWIDVMGADGDVIRCRKSENGDLFRMTLGGMGLTGVILRAGLRLRPVESAWIVQETTAAPDLDALLNLFEAQADRPYLVAWVDCTTRGAGLGRGIAMAGRHAALDDLTPGKRARPFETPARRARRLPVDLPQLALNRFTARAFNAAYYRNGAREAGTALVDWDSYFYPLDAVLDWNRAYGRRGFYQFQCVIPLAQGRAGIRALIETVAASGRGAFLSVLKQLGPSSGALSFPMEGYTLALDFPRAAWSERLMERLDSITLAHGGRFYLAKDARLARGTFRSAETRAQDFAEARRAAGHSGVFGSAQSERLGL